MSELRPFWNSTCTRRRRLIAVALAATLFAPIVAAVEIEVAPGVVEILEDDLCSLSEAIRNANADSQVDNDDCPAGFTEDTIILAAGATYTLTEPLPELFYRLVLEGRGATIERDAGLACVLDDTPVAGEFPLLQIGVGNSGLHIVTVRDLTLRGGCNDGGFGGNDGGAIVLRAAQLNLERVRVEDSQAWDNSGGIDLGAAAVLTATDSVFTGNYGRRGAGAIGNGDGCETTVLRSSISGNTSGGEGGGGIGNYGLLRIENSTISGNSSTGDGGGGVGNGLDAVAEIVSSTIWDNAVTGMLGGGGIGNAGMLTIKNSIVGGSTAGGDCLDYFGNGLEAVGVNFDTDGTCAAEDADFTEVSAAALALSPPAGPATIHTTGATSVAVDAALDCTELDGATPVATDQRGLQRPQDGDGDLDAQCDVGAYERDLPLFEDGFETGDTTDWSATVP